MPICLAFVRSFQAHEASLRLLVALLHADAHPFPTDEAAALADGLCRRPVGRIAQRETAEQVCAARVVARRGMATQGRNGQLDRSGTGRRGVGPPTLTGSLRARHRARPLGRKAFCARRLARAGMGRVRVGGRGRPGRARDAAHERGADGGLDRGTDVGAQPPPCVTWPREIRQRGRPREALPALHPKPVCVLPRPACVSENARVPSQLVRLRC